MPKNPKNGEISRSLLFWGALNAVFFAATSNAIAADPIGWLANSIGIQSHGYQPQNLSPMNRQGYYWTNYLGGGVDANGYYSQPIPSSQVWGVPLADGKYRSIPLWEAEQINRPIIRLNDGTVYFAPKGRYYQASDQGGNITYYDLTTTQSTLIFEIKGGNVIRQDWEFNRPAPPRRHWNNIFGRWEN